MPPEVQAPRIRFGTDGWRGVIADDFTEANAATVVQAAATAWADEAGGHARPLVVGYDTRFNSRAPVISYSVIAREAAGGLVVTASHNPARFNGIKLKGAFGGSADPEFTGRVEAALGRTPPRRLPAAGGGRIETVDLLPDYRPPGARCESCTASPTRSSADSIPSRSRRTSTSSPPRCARAARTSGSPWTGTATGSAP